MAKLSLTRAQVMAAGLALAGRPDLTSEARLWLNLFLEEFYMSQDVDWLIKTLDGSAVSDGMAMPSDYRAAKTAYINQNGSEKEIDVFNDPDEFDARKKNTSGTGVPSAMYADHQQSKFYFDVTPVSGLLLDLKYYHYPALPDYTDAGTDSETIVWGMSSHTLVDFVKAMAMEYNDDQRQDAAFEKVMQRIAMVKFNSRDSRAGNTRIKMGRRFKKRLR